MAENELPDQVLVEIGGNYELVDRKNLITPESVSSNFVLVISCYLFLFIFTYCHLFLS